MAEYTPTGETVTFTVPDYEDAADGPRLAKDLADDIAAQFSIPGRAETFTNKTLTAPNIDSPTISGAFISSASLTNDLDANSHKVVNLSLPSVSSDAATKGYVDAEVAAVVDAAPGALDTLNELAAALGDDANFSTTVTNSIATKVAKAGDTVTGDLTMSGGATVKGLPDPSVSSDAVNLGYVTTLYGSTSSAAASATAAAASESAAIASQTAASGSASAAAASASAASSSASSASTSASNAATSESNAATSQVAAAASKTATDAVYTAAQLNFGDGRAPVFLMMGG